jgi:hypothetical protein
MNVGFPVKKLFSPRFLLISLICVVTSFFLSQYISRNYGLPLWITIQIKSEKNILLDVYYDIGKGYGEQYKIGQRVSGSDDFQAVKLRLPLKHLKSFRIDPITESGTVFIKAIELSSLFGRHHTWLPDNILRDFRPIDISRFEMVNNSLLIESAGKHPYLLIAAPVPLVNEIGAVKIMTAGFSLFLSFFLVFKILGVIDVKKPLNFFLNVDVKQKYLIVLIAAFVFVINYKKLHLYFLSDDFWFIWRYRFLKDVFLESASYHINPVTQFFIFYLGNRIAGLNPFYYHVITLVLHICNVLLVFKLAQTLFSNKWTSLAASLLFATCFMNYEVIYWITGVFYLLLTFFYILAILFFIAYLKEKSARYYALFGITFLLAVFTMEQGMTLLGACIFCEIFMSNHLFEQQSSRLKRARLFVLKSKKYMPLLIILIAFFILKQSMKQHFVVNTQTMDSFVTTVFDTVWYLFVPYPYHIAQSRFRIYLMLLGGGLISFVLMKQYRRQRNSSADNPIIASEAVKYLFLFGSLLSYVLPQSIAAGMQARYFYLPSVFSSIILGNLLITHLSLFAKSKKYVKDLFHLAIIIFFVVSIPINIKFLHAQYYHWKTASEITKNIINDTKRYLPEGKWGQNIYYVNLPDGIYSDNNFGWPDAYVFRNAVDFAIRLSYPTELFGAIVACKTETPEVIPSFGAESITKDRLHRLAKDEENIVLLYDVKKQTIRKLMPADAL